MSKQPTGYNLPTFANVDAYIRFSRTLQLSSACTDSALATAQTMELARSASPEIRSDVGNSCYEAFTGRIHELMHYRSHQAEF